MENPCRLLIFGDSIAKGIAPHIQQYLSSKFKEDNFDITVINQGISSETSNDCLVRLEKALEQRPTTVIINCGMNDWRKNVSKETFKNNFEQIINFFLKNNIRVIVNTINPDHNGATFRFSQPDRTGPSKEIIQYNEIIKESATKYQVRIADVYTYWQRFFAQPHKGLEDAIHPSSTGYAVMLKAIIPVLIKTQMLVLWQFNGRYAHCNYSCPYCYVPTSVNKGMHFNFSLDKWESAFNRHFGNQKTVYYFSYGEPLIAQHYYEILEMIAKNKHWEAKTTSNVSVPLDRLLNSTLAKEGRLNINASFHPTQTSLAEFIRKLDQIRSAGIEPSVVYVMYPPQIEDFERHYMPAFRKAGYIVHIRAFRGLHKGRKYPGAYSTKQWAQTAKYMDQANLKYQLGEVNALGRLNCIGMTHILVDNLGEIEMCDSYVGDRRYGNLFNDKLNLDLEPQPFPGLVPLAAVDDIADYVELEYKDLVGNNVLSYAKQGGVFKVSNDIKYPFENLDLTNKKIKQDLLTVPNPFIPVSSFWLDSKWFIEHFIYSFLIKKYGKFIWAAIKGKWRLLRKGKLKIGKGFWHS